MLANKNTVGFKTQAEIDAEGKERPFLIQQLTIRPLNRREQDIGTMLRSIRAAEQTISRRLDLYDIYEDFLSTDAHLRSAYDKYVMAVTNIDWQYLDAEGQEVQKMKEWIDSPDFELTVAEVLKSKLWGYTMIEYEFYADGTFKAFLIPRKHMRPKLGIVANQQTGDEGINIREGIYADTVLEAGDEHDLGLLMVAVQYVIFKRASITDWSEFIEVYGRPIIDAVWDGFDEDQKIALTEALDKMGGGGQLIRPAGTTVDLKLGAANNPTGELFKGMYDVCNAEISKLLRGQTETTESSDSSGYAQAKVHAGTENDIDMMNIKFVRRILNKRLLRILELNGVVTPGGSFSVKGENEEQMSKSAKLDMDVKLKNDVGLPMSDDYFYENYGIEKPANYDELKAKQEAAKISQQMGGGLNMAHLSELIKLRDSGFFDEPR